MNYVLLSTKLNGFNANSGFYTIGIPALTAFAGYFHALQRKIDELITQNKIEGNCHIQDFSIACKNVSIRDGHPKYIKLRAHESFNRGTAASTIDEKVGDGEFAFILRIDSDLGEDDFLTMGIHREKNLGYLSSLIKKITNHMKLAGGFLNNTYINQYSSFTQANQKIKHSNYFYLVDESDLIIGKKFNDFVEYIGRPTYSEEDKVREYKPFYIPIIPGYRLLEEPSIKNPMFNSLRNKEFPHAFAEPILSLAKYQSTYSVLHNIKMFDNEEDESENAVNPKIFWQYAPQINDLCVVCAKTL